MKPKLFLALFGACCGLLCAGIAYPLFYRIYDALHPGAQFESIADLRAAIDNSKADASHDAASVNMKGLVVSNPSDSIIYTLKPNLDTTFARANVRTNSFGMRGPEVSVEKPARTIRVALLGDSFAFGWGVERDKIFAQVLEERLQNYVGTEKHIEVLDFGVPGYSTFQEVADFFEKGVQFKPDIVLVYFVENDFDLPFFIRNVQSNDLMHRWKRDDPAVAAERAHMQETMSPNRSLKTLARRGIEEGYAVYLAINPRPEWKEDRAKLKVLDHSMHIHELSISDDFDRIVRERQIPEKDLHLWRDLHPTALKHRILGDLLADALIAQGAIARN